MKQAKSTSKLLGLSQEQLAIILKVSRMQISRYELGLWQLPLTALQRLEPIVKHMFGTSPEIPAATLKQQNDQMKRSIAGMLKENGYQLAFTARQLAQAERRYNAKLKALQVVAFLSAQEEATNRDTAAFLQSISNKASKSLKANGLDLLCRLKIKMEMLELEKQLLEAQAQMHQQ